VSLAKHGESTFKVFGFTATGGPVKFAQDEARSPNLQFVDAIPAAHSIEIEVLEKLGGAPTPEWLVRAGEQRPTTPEDREMMSCEFNRAPGRIPTLPQSLYLPVLTSSRAHSPYGQ
jgi:hypothetical protein